MRFRRLLFMLSVVVLSSCTLVDSEKTANEARYHYLMGSSALNENNPTEALREFLLAEQSDPRDPEIQAGLAQAYLSKQAYTLSEQHYLRAIELSKNDPKYHNNLAALYLNMERFDAAATHFQVAAENLLFNNPEIAWTGLGVARFQMGDYPAAERSYRKAAQVAPRYFRAYYHLGELYFAQDRPAEALEQFSRAVTLVPAFTLGHYWLGLTYMKVEQPEQARAAFKQVIQLAPDSEQARLSFKYLAILN